MMENNWLTSFNWVFLFGLIPSALFSARMLVQWFLSERAKKVVSPLIYWQLSLVASFLMIIYGWLREDFAIIMGQIFSYYVYVWNLKIMSQWEKIYLLLRYLFLLAPPTIIASFAMTSGNTIYHLWTGITFGLLLFGTIGQVTFSFRFVYQWWYSRKLNQSMLPGGFWIISIVGATCNLIYGIIRADYILILNNTPGIISYSRNLYLQIRNK